jgi:hypothetical protein
VEHTRLNVGAGGTTRRRADRLRPFLFNVTVNVSTTAYGRNDYDSYESRGGAVVVTATNAAGVRRRPSRLRATLPDDNSNVNVDAVNILLENACKRKTGSSIPPTLFGTN